MPKVSVIRLLRKCFITEDLDEDLIPMDKQSWIKRLELFKRKLGIKKSKKRINGKDIVFKCIIELLSDHDTGIDMKQLEQYCSNQDIEFYIPQICHYIVQEGRYSDMVEKFILMRASRSVSFAHQVLWSFLSSLDDGNEELTMKTIEFLQALTDQGRKAISQIQNAHLYLSNSQESKDFGNKYMSYKGPVFQNSEPLLELGLMQKLNHDSKSTLFFSTPIFISNLLSISEYLKTVPNDQRPEVLKSMINQINSFLPNNVYIPMGNFNGHRVLKVSLEHTI